jgi:hypothetical protein
MRPMTTPPLDAELTAAVLAHLGVAAATPSRALLDALVGQLDWGLPFGGRSESMEP